jgi:hypothetical protein
MSDVLPVAHLIRSRRSAEFHAGEEVEVRSKEEILATLDERGELDGLPFMPQMFQYCGKRLRVFKRAHKTCDTVNLTGGRRMTDAVHLEEVRCDGQAHGGCDAACLIFWKAEWLKRLDGATSADRVPAPRAGDRPCTEGDVLRAVRARDPGDESDPTYSCQATALPRATTLLPWWDVRQYLEDYTSGNASIEELLGSAAYAAYYRFVELLHRSPIKGAGALVRLYDRVQALRKAPPFPRKRGVIPAGEKTPVRPLDLQPGEWVRVKSHEAILQTLDTNNKNRGLYFDAEEVPFCGGTYRVRSLVKQIIDEQTGKMRPIKGNNVILENVWCQARYSDKRMLCPRAIYPIWRETWLERVAPGPASPP